MPVGAQILEADQHEPVPYYHAETVGDDHYCVSFV